MKICHFWLIWYYWNYFNGRYSNINFCIFRKSLWLYQQQKYPHPYTQTYLVRWDIWGISILNHSQDTYTIAFCCWKGYDCIVYITKNTFNLSSEMRVLEDLQPKFIQQQRLLLLLRLREWERLKDEHWKMDDFLNSFYQSCCDKVDVIGLMRRFHFSFEPFIFCYCIFMLTKFDIIYSINLRCT